MAEPAPPRRRRWRLTSSARLRILAWYVVLLALAMAGSILVGRQVLLASVDLQMEEASVQEVTELRQLIGGTGRDGRCILGRAPDGTCQVGRDPETGEPFGDDIAAIFSTFLSRNVVGEHETLLTFVDGQPYQVPAVEPPYPIASDPRFRALGTVAGRPQRGSFDVADVGEVRYLAVPVQTADGTTRGVLVVAQFADLQRAFIHRTVRTTALAGGLLLVVASVVAFVAAGRVLAPVRLVTETAREISDSDLSRRIPVTGHDEISDLARTFNDMLDRLEAAFEAQRRFVDDAGHELRTPITIIRGHLELLGDDPEERRETIALVTDELDRMTRLVDDLLVLAKAERPDFLSLETVDSAALLADLHSKASALADRDWRVAQGAAGFVVVDRQRITQAMMQLAQNATQHTGAGDTITLGSHVADGDARFWVRDSGPGVAVADAERIFERFARTAAGRRRSTGAGLGLSIVRAIAEAHGGRVELHSIPGDGAAFTIVVPVDQPHPDEEVEPAPADDDTQELV